MIYSITNCSDCPFRIKINGQINSKCKLSDRFIHNHLTTLKSCLLLKETMVLVHKDIKIIKNSI